MHKIIFLGNDLRIHTTILEVTEGIYKDITFSDDFNWCPPTEEMIAENIYDEWTTLDMIAKDYISNYSPYKDYAQLVVVESRVDTTYAYKIDLNSNADWKLIGELNGYGF